MNINFDPINLFLNDITGNLRFLKQVLSVIGAIVLIPGILIFLVVISI